MKTIKKKKCDSCGKYFVTKAYPIYDENYNVQPGLFHCGCAFST